MKRLLIAVILLAISTTALAQLQGEYYIGGSLGYSTGKSVSKVVGVGRTETPGGDNLSITPEFGYFIKNRLRVSGYLGYGWQSQKLEQVDGAWLRQNTHAALLGAGISYYVRLANNFYYAPEVALGVAMGAGIQDVTMVDDLKYVAVGFYTDIKLLALEYRPMERFAFNVSLASLNYNLLGSPKYKTLSSSLSFNLLTNASVAFRYYFGRTPRYRQTGDKLHAPRTP